MTDAAQIAQDARDEIIQSLERELHLLREEMSGLRQMLEGSMAALQGAQKAYAAIAQRADLLDARFRHVRNTPTF
jgi:hypothetical protein